MGRIEDLAKRIEDANDAYYNAEPTISDEEYDALKDELQDLDPKNSVLAKVGAPVRATKWDKVEHDVPMRSQDKVNTIPELKDWISSRGAEGQELCAQEKLDGISLSLNYTRGHLVSAVTRGDGEIGEDIFTNVLKMKGVIPELGEEYTGSIRGEIVLFKKDWKEHLPELSNPRNGASGVAKRFKGGGQEHLTVLCYEMVGGHTHESEWAKVQHLRSLGFLTPNTFIGTVDDIENTYQRYHEGKRESLDYEIDGLVIKINSLGFQERLGHGGPDNDGNPKGQVALKFANEMRETVLEDVLWEVGLTGRVTPVACVRPVYVAGVTVSRASLHNAKLLQGLGVGIGSRILISRRNDVIPMVEEALGSGDRPVEIPTSCPQCDSTLANQGEYLVCENEGCKTAGNVRKWIDVVEIDSVGPKAVDLFIKNGLVSKPGDLYRLKEEDLAKLPRMGEKSAAKIVQNIQGKKEVHLYQFLAGLNIPSCGRRVFKNVISAGYASLEDVINAQADKLASIEGLGDIMAGLIQEGLEAKKDNILDLLDAGVTIKAAVTEESSGGALTGKSFCFTGTMNRGRKELEAMALSAGGEVKSVSSNLSYLVIADPTSNSSKAKKARGLGVQLISEEQFLEMAGQ